MEAEKDQEIRRLTEDLDSLSQKYSEMEEYFDRIKNSGRCIDPEVCREEECDCKYDV